MTAAETVSRVTAQRRILAERSEQRIVQSAIDQATERIVAAFRRPA